MVNRARPVGCGQKIFKSSNFQEIFLGSLPSGKGKMDEKVLRPLMKTATRRIWALKIRRSPKFERTKDGGRSICRDAMDLVYKYNGSLILSAQNLWVAKFECSESVGCWIWVLRICVSPNLSINLLIMCLNTPQTIRMSEHRGVMSAEIQQVAEFERSKITGRWFWVQKSNESLNLCINLLIMKFSLNYQDVRTQTEVSWVQNIEKRKIEW